MFAILTNGQLSIPLQKNWLSPSEQLKSRSLSDSKLENFADVR